MVTADQVVEFLEASRRELTHSQALIDQMERLVESRGSPTNHRIRNIKLRLAMHYSPKSIIDVSSLDLSDPKYIICKEYIEDNFDHTNNESKEIAKSVQRVLDLWEEDREQITGYREKLLRRQSYRCQSCNLHFNEECASYVAKDEFKPVYLQDELTNPEVDHEDPVWALGHNKISNAQILCRFCNQGKGEEGEIDVSAEMGNSTMELSKLSWKYRAQLAYITLIDATGCSQCGSTSRELTVRKIRNSGCYVRSNLQSICVKCAYD